MLESDIRGSKQFRNWFHDRQHLKIVRLVVCRTILHSAISKVADLLSFGKFSQIKGKLGYDNLYHLYLYIVFENGEEWKLEKNQVINLRQGRPDPSSECHAVTIPQDFNLNMLMHGAFQMMGANFAVYTPFKYNCQDFILNILKYSNLLTNDLYNFIYQKTEELRNTIPSFGQYMAQFAIDTARKIDTLIHGAGKPKFRSKRKSR